MAEAKNSQSRLGGTVVWRALLVFIAAASALAASLGTGLRGEDQVATAGYGAIGFAFLGFVLTELARPPVDAWPRRLYLSAQFLLAVGTFALSTWLVVR